MEVWNSNPSYPYMGRSPTWSTSVTLWQTSKIASYTDSGEMMMLLTIASLMTSNRRRRGPCKSHWWIGKGQKRQDYAVTIFLQLISRQRRKIPTNGEKVIRTWKGEYWNLKPRDFRLSLPGCRIAILEEKLFEQDVLHTSEDIKTSEFNLLRTLSKNGMMKYAKAGNGQTRTLYNQKLNETVV